MILEKWELGEFSLVSWHVSWTIGCARMSQKHFGQCMVNSATLRQILQKKNLQFKFLHKIVGFPPNLEPISLFRIWQFFNYCRECSLAYGYIPYCINEPYFGSLRGNSISRFETLLKLLKHLLTIYTSSSH
jgi:hypothetical protein